MPSRSNIAKISQGISKDKIYSLLGPPHFHEGFVAVREWDYIFTFNNTEKNVEEQCQFKIIYNQTMRVQDTYWKPESCSEYATERPSSAEPIVKTIIQHEKETITLINLKMNSDGLFEFGKSAMQYLLPGGKQRLDKSISEIRNQGEVVNVKVLGYADRLGSDQYNAALSLSRAKTIKDYLVSHGIPAEKVVVDGMGESAPLVVCEQKERSAKLIECLQPNRRFEIEFEVKSVASNNIQAILDNH